MKKQLGRPSLNLPSFSNPPLFLIQLFLRRFFSKGGGSTIRGLLDVKEKKISRFTRSAQVVYMLRADHEGSF